MVSSLIWLYMISETLQKSVLQRYDEARRKTKKKHSFFSRIRFIMDCHLSFVICYIFAVSAETKGFRVFFAIKNTEVSVQRHPGV